MNLNPLIFNLLGTFTLKHNRLFKSVEKKKQNFHKVILSFKNKILATRYPGQNAHW